MTFHDCCRSIVAYNRHADNCPKTNHKCDWTHCPGWDADHSKPGNATVDWRNLRVGDTVTATDSDGNALRGKVVRCVTSSNFLAMKLAGSYAFTWNEWNYGRVNELTFTDLEKAPLTLDEILDKYGLDKNDQTTLRELDMILYNLSINE